MNEQIKHYQQKLEFEWDSADLFDELQKGSNVIVVDARKEDAFRREHIPGAVNIPHGRMDADSTKNLNRETTYVCYCDGIGCNASTKGSLKMTQLDFKVRELMGGLDWWKRDGYATDGQDGVTGTEFRCAC